MKVKRRFGVEITCDIEKDSLYLNFSDKEAMKQELINAGAVRYIGQDGKTVGIEMLNATGDFGLEILKHIPKMNTGVKR